jgi:hypothetical protein
MKLSELHTEAKKKSKNKKYNVQAPGFIKPGEELANIEYQAAVSPNTSAVPTVDPHNVAPRPVDKPGSAGEK